MAYIPYSTDPPDDIEKFLPNKNINKMDVHKNLLPSSCYKKGRKVPVDCMVLHYISAKYVLPNDKYNVEACIQILKDYKLSYHFLISSTGRIIKLVDPKDTAWHAGVSEFEGRKNVNDFSIGVGLINDGESEYKAAQYISAARLYKHCLTDYEIPINRIVGHENVSPGRKKDPGPHFIWSRFINLAWNI